jgi:hypothetical protein
MSNDTTPVRNDALSRASTLANRARELRRAQAEVQELTLREVQVLARTAASFFDAIPLVEFTTTLLPQSARGLRRIRHRVLHRTIHHTETGTLIRALLLGRDGSLRLFSARSAESRDLLLILEPGRTLPVGVMRDVVDWTPTLRVPGFRPFDILDKLSHALDAVEEQIGDAEQRVQVQKAALQSGDLTPLLIAKPAHHDDTIVVHPNALASALRQARVHAPVLKHAADVAVRAPASPAVAAPAPSPFDMFDIVEAVAAAAVVAPSVPQPVGEATAAVPSALPSFPPDAEPDEWDDPVEVSPGKSAPAPKAAQSGPAVRSLFPAMPSPR